MGLRVCSEVFADRVYRPDGTLVPRGLPGAMIENEEDAIARVVQMAKQGTVCAADGSTMTFAGRFGLRTWGRAQGTLLCEAAFRSVARSRDRNQGAQRLTLPRHPKA